MSFLNRFILRFPVLVLLITLGLALVGARYSVELYKNLRTDLEELLPTTARSVLDLNEVTHRLESIENLAILILSDHPEASRRFVTDLAHRLERAPKDTISSVEYRIDHELRYFKDREALYIDLPDLKRIRDYVGARIDYEKKLYNPLNIFSGVNIPEPLLDFLALRKKYNQKTTSYSRFPEGYYATPDEKKRVILAYMPGKASGVGSISKLKDFVDRSIKELNPASYASDIQIHFTGGVQDTFEEQQALVEDLELSTVIVLIVVSLAMLIFYRAFRATLALLVSLFAGTLWTFGISYFAVGYLNANSAFLGSIVIGNGINCGIIFLARYLEERRKGMPHDHSLHVAMTETPVATFTAALAAGLSYGSLILTGFRGFKQFGVIGLIGMVLCWISAYTVLPALLTFFDRRKPLVSSLAKPKSAPLATWVANAVSRAPLVIWVTSILITILSVAMFSRYTPRILETDLSKLRNRHSIEEGSLFYSNYLDEIFQRYLSPMVILPREREKTGEIARVLKEQQKIEGKRSLLASVQTIDDFVPKDQVKKVEILREIQALLPPKILRRMTPEDQTRVESFLKPEAFHPIKLPDLPELVLNKFREKDGSIGKLVLVEPPLSHETLDGNNLMHFIAELRSTTDEVAPGTPIAGSLAISADMIEAISRDGPKATLFAFIAVVTLVILLFRNLKTISLILFALILGVVWLGGVIFGFGIKINFLNFIALPITFGIGVDYGVNIFQRFRAEGPESMMRVIRDTGGAVALCSFTTIVGYSSLLLASNQAFVSFGLLAVVGEVTCVVAAVISLPSFLLYLNRKKRDSKLSPL